MKNKFLIIIMLVAAGFVSGYAQEFTPDVSKKGTTAASFLSIAQGARASAMGSAFVGLANDAGSLYWNPAAIAAVKGFGASFDHTQWIADLNYNYIAAAYCLGDYGTVGLSFTSANYGDMKVTTIDSPEGTGETFSASDAAFSIAYAVNLTDKFSIGFNPKFIYQSIYKMTASAVAVDLGVKYVTPFDGIVLAMSISNFGGKMQLSGNSTTVLYDIDNESTGNNEKVPANLSTDEWALPLIYRVGLAYTVNFSDMHKLNLAADALHPSDNFESINVGAEYAFNDFLFLRGGYKGLFQKDSEEKYTFGFGIKQQLLGNVGIMVDYAYCDFGRLKNVQKFSLGVTF